jgi:hypothetical protein
MGLRKVDNILVGSLALPRWKGQAYRADSGYSSTQTAGDEATEFLDQQDQLEPWHKTLLLLIPFLRRIPSREMYWVTKKRADAIPYATRYGAEIDRFNLPYAVIVGDDGEGGYLIVEDYRRLTRG